jgi:hypothetical protein
MFFCRRIRDSWGSKILRCAQDDTVVLQKATRRLDEAARIHPCVASQRHTQEVKVELDDGFLTAYFLSAILALLHYPDPLTTQGESHHG